MTKLEIDEFIKTIDIDEFIVFFKTHGKLTIMEHYNIPNEKALYRIRDAIGFTLTKEELNIKNAISVREGCQRKWGVDNPGQVPEIKEKIKQVTLEKYGVTCSVHNPEVRKKVEATMMERYGTTYILDIPEVAKKAREKAKETMLSRYGVEHTAQLPEVRQKRLNTLKKNKTFVTSKYEESFNNLLVEKVGRDNFTRQYKSERYPFACDFYIKPLDIFIELNICWTHGWRPYNETDPVCIEQLEKWKVKAETSNFYKVAIDVWTQRDTLKFKTAAENNLNYKVFYKYSEAEEWLNNLSINNENLIGDA